MHENHDDDSDVDADQTAEIEKKPVADIVSSEYKYKQRVMLLSSRGIGHRFRHMMNDLSAMLPHSKKDNKLDVKANVQIINELAELNNCNNCIFFEVRRHEDLYLWVSRTPNGPSARFFVQDVHTMEELRMIGNCLKGSRPIVSFDQTFDTTPQYKLIKELFTQVFSTPRTSRRIKPFVDHVLSFSVSDDRIWFRNYQIVEKEGPGSEISLVEIGPRFMLTIVRIFEGSFGGPTLYHSSSFVSPAQV
ncbi:Brix domain-containing protein [Cladochytrium replicatum]|nr:Brix domain-containing protein [Cladochytrium replicatum]